MIPACRMGKRRKSASGEVRVVDPLVQQLVGQIIAKTPKTRVGLGKGAKRHVQTLYGWLNGRRRSPSLLAFSDYATAAGLTLVLSDGTHTGAACGRPHVTSEFEKNILVAIRALTDENDQDELLTIVRDFVLAHTSGSRGPPSGPREPVEQAEE